MAHIRSRQAMLISMLLGRRVYTGKNIRDRNLLFLAHRYHIPAWLMTYLPQPNSYWRSPRVRLADITPAVLRLQDGCRSRGKLETVSLTGGLRSLTSVLVRGSRIKLLFLTHTGQCLGAAEMLSPVSTTRQPFRFVALEEGDQRRLRAVVQSFLDPGEQTWIEKYRAAKDTSARASGVTLVKDGPSDDREGRRLQVSIDCLQETHIESFNFRSQVLGRLWGRRVRHSYRKRITCLGQPAQAYCRQ